jgi:hypothetical protein
MTPNLKRLGALAAAQCASFAIVVLFGILGGPGHQTHTSSVPPHRTARQTTPDLGPAGQASPGHPVSLPSRPPLSRDKR